MNKHTENSSVNIPIITAKAFCASLEKALVDPPDVDMSIRRIQRILTGLPDQQLYVSDQNGKVTFRWKVDGKLTYLSKKSTNIHKIARRRYLLLLLEILKLCKSEKVQDVKRRKLLFRRLVKLLDEFERGNLDIAQIVLTNKQLKWFRGPFQHKYIDLNTMTTTAGGIPVRSKSERDIANANEALAVPFHYEERTVIYVHDLVVQLEETLKREKRLNGHLYRFGRERIHWNVPPDLEWMNAPGSIWKTYYPPNGTITIYNDFIIMLADGELLIWEHEGLMQDFRYRCQASERASIMKYTGTVVKENLIETYEHDIDTPEKLIDIIERRILPRLWF